MLKSEELKLPEPDKKLDSVETQQQMQIQIPQQQKSDEEQKKNDLMEQAQTIKQVTDLPIAAEVFIKEMAVPKHRGRPPKKNRLNTEVQAPKIVTTDPIMNEKSASESKSEPNHPTELLNQAITGQIQPEDVLQPVFV